MDPELLNIGNKVVFGFQPHLITTDRDRSGSGKIVIEDGGKFQVGFHSDFVIVLTLSLQLW